MQRITKFSALIGFLAVMTFAIGLFMFAPSFTGHSFSSGIPAAHAAMSGDGGTGCSGCGNFDHSTEHSGNGCSFNCTPTTPVYPSCTAISANPSEVTPGGAVTISWSTTNAVYVTLNGINVTGHNSYTFYPTHDTTYTIVVTSSTGHQDTCSKVVTVVTPTPACVSFDASASTITSGQAVTLTWVTTNATAATLNGAAVAVNGSISVYPTQTTTYTLALSNNSKTAVCQKTIVVTPVVVNDPSCMLDAAPATISNGQSAILSWSMQNAATAFIDQGVGSVQLNVNGSKSVSPTQTTTYTFTVTGNNKTVTCQKQVVVTTNNSNLACNSFTASPSSLPQGGGTTQLSWTTTGASYVNLDQGVGTNLRINDSKSVFVPDNRNYTLTAYDSQGHSVSCVTSVSVDHGGGGGGGGGGTTRPSCTLFHTSTHNVSAGQKATLSWTTIRGSELTITDNRDKEIFNTSNRDEVWNGQVDVAPTRDTKYTLTVSKNGKTDSCDVQVYADNGGAGVTVIRDRQPVTTITFRDVPYTGFDAGPILAGTFYALLAMWALVAAYVIVIQKGSVMGLSLATAGFAAKTRRTVAPVVTRTATAVAPTNLPTASDEDEEEEEVVEEEEMGGEEESSLQNRAFVAGVILSQDALKAVVRAGTSLPERMTILDAVLARAKESLPREGGWIALDRARISALFN
jgi:uncharacterized cupredoxin-like copper-binding protein